MVRIGRICLLAGIVAIGAWFWRKKKIDNTCTMCFVRYSYESTTCHGNIVVDINGKLDTLKELDYCGDSMLAIYRYTAGGDTIIKDDVKRIFTLQNRGKKMTFHYPEQVVTQVVE